MYAGYKKETKNIEAVKDKIMTLKRAGKCNSSGGSVKTDSGRRIPVPRGGRPTFRKTYSWLQGT